MSISKKIALGLFCVSGSLISTAAYLDKGLISFLVFAAGFVCVVSIVVFIEGFKS